MSCSIERSRCGPGGLRCVTLLLHIHTLLIYCVHVDSTVFVFVDLNSAARKNEVKPDINAE